MRKMAYTISVIFCSSLFCGLMKHRESIHSCHTEHCSRLLKTNGSKWGGGESHGRLNAACTDVWCTSLSFESVRFLPAVLSAVIEQFDHVWQKDPAHLHALLRGGRVLQQSSYYLQNLWKREKNPLCLQSEIKMLYGVKKKKKRKKKAPVLENIKNTASALCIL